MVKQLLSLFAFLCLVIPTNSIAGTDFILVVDHSNSMKGNDPLRIRLDAASMAVDTADRDDRVAVVVFSKNARTAIPLSRVTSANIDSYCHTIRHDHKNLGIGTDIIDALKTAYIEAEKSVASGRSCEVFLLTDGRNDRIAGRYPDIERALDGAVSRFASNQIPVHAIALGKAADTKSLRKISKRTNGAYFTPANARDLLAIYLKLISAGKGMVAIESSNFFVWPNSEKLNIILFKPKPDPTPMITSVLGGGEEYLQRTSGISMTRTRTRADRPRFYDFVKIDRPQTGQWAVKSQGEGDLRIHALQTAPFVLKLNHPRKTKQVAGDDILFEAELIGRKGVSSKTILQIAEQTRMEVTLTLPDGRKTNFPLSYNKDNHRFLFSTRKKLVQIGDYFCHLEASFHHGKSEPWTASRSSIFYLGPPDFALTILTPPNGATVEPGFEPIDFSAVIDKTDPRLKVDRIPDNTSFQVQVLDENQQVISRKSLRSRSAKIQALMDAQTTAGNFWPPGRYTLRASSTGSGFSIREDNATFSVSPLPEPDIAARAVIKLDAPDGLIAGLKLGGEIAVYHEDGRKLFIGHSAPSGWNIAKATVTRWHGKAGQQDLSLAGLPPVDTKGAEIVFPFAIPGLPAGGIFLKGRVTLDLALRSPGGMVVQNRQVDLVIAPVSLEANAFNWPHPSEFTIEHTIPRQITVRQDVTIYPDHVTAEGKKMENPCIIRLVHSPSRTVIRQGVQLLGKYRVDKLKWGLPTPDFVENVEGEHEGEHNFIGSFWNTGKFNITLRVEDLGLSSVAHPHMNRSYSDIHKTAPLNVTEAD